MYKNILVPLDGSKMSECVLSHVNAVAGGCGVAAVTFLRVVEPVHIPSGAGSDAGSAFTEEDAIQLRKQSEEFNHQEAEQYLNGILLQNKYAGTVTKAEVLNGSAADTIIDYIGKNDVDLVVMATHGRSGISRWVWGSVADRVIRSSKAPVLIVRPRECPVK